MSLTMMSYLDVSPSFEQMEEAIDKLVKTAVSNGTLSDDDLINVNEKVSAWCWLTLKVCIVKSLFFVFTYQS